MDPTPDKTRRIRATVNYILNPPAVGEAQLVFDTENEAASTMRHLPGAEVWISNGRELPLSLDIQGFQLLNHPTSITDFDAIEFNQAHSDLYMAEVGRLICEVTGAAQTLPLGGVKQRFSEGATDKLAPLLNAKPARYPHADNTDESSDVLIHFFAEQMHGLDLKQFSRYALYNLWRCVSPPPQDCPLALCDVRSIAPDDELAITAVTQEHGIGEIRHDTSSYVFNPEHAWYYFPDMTPNEVIVFKTHDSDPSRPRRVAHTAFDDPDCPPDTHPRASVEARILALFS